MQADKNCSAYVVNGGSCKILLQETNVLILTELSWDEPALCNGIQQNSASSPGKLF